jgi:hypothetical protein
VLKSKTLTIPDLEALMSAALFNPNYLHLDHAAIGWNVTELALSRSIDDRFTGSQP